MPSEHGPVRALVERAHKLTWLIRNRPEWEAICAEADALDAELTWTPPADAALSELTITELVDSAYVAGMETERAGESLRSDVSRGQELINEARRRDAARALAGTWQPVEKRVFYPFGDCYVHIAENGVMNVGTESNGPSISFRLDDDYAFCRRVSSTPAWPTGDAAVEALAAAYWYFIVETNGGTSWDEVAKRVREVRMEMAAAVLAKLNGENQNER